MNHLAEQLACALACHKRGEADQAAAQYRQVLAVEPRNTKALQGLGVLLAQTGRCDEAIELLKHAVAIEPNNAACLTNLGSAYLAAGRHKEAESALCRAVAADPNHADARFNLGVALARLKRPEEAIACYRRATNINPDHAAAFHNLGAALQELGRPHEALHSFQKACRLQPSQAEAHFNLATALMDLGDPAAAIACYQRALELQPDDAQARCGRGTARLCLGEFRSGWSDYEYRVACPQFNMLRLAEPPWDGSPLTDGTLLVHCEQGLGDTMQFIRFVPVIRPRCGRLIIAAQAALIPLLAHAGFTDLIPHAGPLPPYDAQVPLMSLPRLLAADEPTIPREVPYLDVAPSIVEKWRQSLAGHDGLSVGIAWQGHRGFHGDALRSIPLESFAPLAAVEGVRLVSLQKRDGVEQLAEVAERFAVVDLGPELDEQSGAFVDTAAVMKNLDLVVTSDTAIAHLAGALGVPVWVALGVGPDWRWMRKRADSPWYPTMRLFRQSAPGDWQAVFTEIAEEIRALICRRAR